MGELIEDGGRDAMVQQLANRYVGELADMAKNSSMVIVPDKPNDISGVVASRVERFGCRATESFESFRSEFGQNSVRIQENFSEFFRNSDILI